MNNHEASTKYGVLVTVHNHGVDWIDNAAAAEYSLMRLSVPHQTTWAVGGDGARFDEVFQSLGLAEPKLAHHQALGQRSQRTSLDNDEWREIRELVGFAPDNFVLIGDPCVVRMFSETVRVQEFAIYLLTIRTNGTTEASLLDSRNSGERLPYPFDP